MQKWIDRINRPITFLLMVLMAGIVVDVTWQVVSRFIVRRPSSFSEELAGFLLIWIGLLGAAYAYYTRAHLGIDILTGRLKGAGKRLVEIISHSAVFLFALFVMVVGGIRLVRLTFTLRQISPALHIPIGYVYLVIPLAGVLIMLYAVRFIVHAGKPAPSTDHLGVD
jgi:TRAP-type C4-dicarboxylate transport system permease small subunit